MPNTQRLSESENEYFATLIINKNINALKEFINSRGMIDTSQSILDMSYQSFLQIAVIYSSYSILELLLQRCAFNLGYQDENGNTIYHYAADLNKNNELMLLLRNDYKSASIANKKGNTPHDITKMCGNDIGSTLLSNIIAPLKILSEITIINNLCGDANDLDVPRTIINEIQSVPQEHNILKYSIDILGDI